MCSNRKDRVIVVSDVGNEFMLSGLHWARNKMKQNIRCDRKLVTSPAEHIHKAFSLSFPLSILCNANGTACLSKIWHSLPLNWTKIKFKNKHTQVCGIL